MRASKKEVDCYRLLETLSLCEIEMKSFQPNTLLVVTALPRAVFVPVVIIVSLTVKKEST